MTSEQRDQIAAILHSIRHMRDMERRLSNNYAWSSYGRAKAATRADKWNDVARMIAGIR